MTSNMTRAEIEQFRRVLEDLPPCERAKIKAVMKSGRLVSFVSFLDAVVQFFEKMGRLGVWINNVLRPILTALAVLAVFYLVLTGKISIAEFWK